jgi:L-ascorbate metabolism protein UlaG (beta-lactamase superfamily)
MADATLTWLGHASFRIDTPAGTRIYVDPWLTQNPSCPESEKEPERIDVLALTHGHFDHVGDTVELSKRFEPEIVAQVELKAWLGKQGAPVGEMPGINKGGSTQAGGCTFTLTNAFHSSSSPDGEYLGESCGLVIGLDGGKTIYFAGDTCVFGDMQLIARIYQPDLVVLPIGDYFTMGPREAAVALELLGNPRCVPSHYATFPLLSGTPDKLRELASQATIESPEPGGSVEI